MAGKKDAAWWREYRARKSALDLDEYPLLAPAATPLRDALVDREVRAAAKASVPAARIARVHNVIAAMPQADKDRILARIGKPLP